MKERPIIFSAPMVRALLDGTKTQTRWVVNKTATETLNWFGGKSGDDDDRPTNELLGQRQEDDGLLVWCYDYPEEGGEVIKCPYGQPGDRIWLRETVIKQREIMAYAADNEPVDCGGLRWPSSIEKRNTISSIHMPKWACRLVLEITAVRVERLQDISEADAAAEGVTAGKYTGLDRANARAYSVLWESINGPDSWAQNPWVWVIEFKRVQPIPENCGSGHCSCIECFKDKP